MVNSVSFVYNMKILIGMFLRIWLCIISSRHVFVLFYLGHVVILYGIRNMYFWWFFLSINIALFFHHVLYDISNFFTFKGSIGRRKLYSLRFHNSKSNIKLFCLPNIWWAWHHVQWLYGCKHRNMDEKTPTETSYLRCFCNINVCNVHWCSMFALPRMSLQMS